MQSLLCQRTNKLQNTEDLCQNLYTFTPAKPCYDYVIVVYIHHIL